jgi:hypothetical protein
VVKHLSFLIVFAFTGEASIGDETDDPNASSCTVVYRALASISPATINHDLKVGVPTVNVAIYLGETDGTPHGYVASSNELTESFERAKEIFA